jgi:hypothetical protein
LEGDQAQTQGRYVGQHVPSIRKEGKAVGQNAPDQLHHKVEKGDTQGNG